jgi:ubiquinone/menaquinone biosynthesis C-methylase UbiE
LAGARSDFKQVEDQMKLGIIPEGLFDWIALASGRVPEPIIETFWGVAVGRTVMAGARFGIFDLLKGREMTAAEMATECASNPAAMETLLNALNGFGYLKRNHGKYSLSKKSEKWLVKGSPSAMGDTVLFFAELFPILEHMEEIVRTGKSENIHNMDTSPRFWRHYMRGLASMARPTAPAIVKKIDLKGRPAKMLDVGGGHGIFSVELIKRFPGLESTVLDLPQAAEHGEKIVAELGFADRVRFIKGDLRRMEWGEGYDLALLFNIVHNLSSFENEHTLRKTIRALKPGGTVAILDSEHPGTEKDLTAASGFNEVFFLALSGAQAYPEKTIRQWLAAAGFVEITRRKILAMPMTMLLQARKPV